MCLPTTDRRQTEGGVCVVGQWTMTYRFVCLLSNFLLQLLRLRDAPVRLHRSAQDRLRLGLIWILRRSHRCQSQLTQRKHVFQRIHRELQSAVLASSQKRIKWKPQSVRIHLPCCCNLCALSFHGSEKFQFPTVLTHSQRLTSHAGCVCSW